MATPATPASWISPGALYVHYTFDETDGGRSPRTPRATSSTGWSPGWDVGAGKDRRRGVPLRTAAVRRAPHGILEKLDDITVAFWINWGGGALWQRPFDFGRGATVWMYVTPNSYMTTLQGLRFAMSGGSLTEYATGENLPVGVWTHVAVTLHKPNSWLYVDGQPQANSNAMVNPAAGSGEHDPELDRPLAVSPRTLT